MGEDDGSPCVAAEFEEYARRLDEINERRERLVKASRDVTIQSKKVIFAIHRATTPQALAAAAQQLASLRSHHITQVARELSAEDYWRFTRAHTWGLQEYVEAASFLHFRQTGGLLTLAQVNGAFEGVTDRDGRTFHVHAADYVLGLADLTGEVMRLAVSSRGSVAAAASGDGDGGSAGRGSSKQGKRAREWEEAKGEAEGGRAEGGNAEGGTAKVGSLLVVDADACKLFVQRLHAGFSVLPRSSELSKEMGKKMDVMLASLNKIENVSYARFVRGSEYPEDLLQLGLEAKEAGTEGD
ncbi:hypothetical protein CLOM_g10594 [Closterium sp. NIES-68]|nr:hypothetical protein CLOM_g10594 [Closterium sp. NIES-68]